MAKNRKSAKSRQANLSGGPAAALAKRQMHLTSIDFAIVDWFVTKEYAALAKEAIGHSLGVGVTLDSWDAHFSKRIPLFLCETREDLKKCGVKCPYEFIIERSDFVPLVGIKYESETKNSGKQNPIAKIVASASKLLSDRLNLLRDLYCKNGNVEDFKLSVRDWLAGTFRLYMMLDSSTHGMTKYIDLEQVKTYNDKILLDLVDKHLGIQAAELYRRFSSGDDVNGTDATELLRLKSHMRTLFGEYFREWRRDEEQKPDNICRSITKVITWRNDSSEDKLTALARIYEDGERIWDQGAHCERPLAHAERLPIAYGERAKYITPTRKLNLLLVDDDIDASPIGYIPKVDKDQKDQQEEEITSDKTPSRFVGTISDDDWRLLCEVFNVQTLPVGKNVDVREFVMKRFAALQQLGMTYDLILIDLCLGSMETNSDPDGYAVIRLAKMFFPGTPIVVYSRFKDMEHIARAFFSGARWFLIKGEEAKLPRHVLKLIKHVGWHREWQSVENSAEKPEFVYAKSDDFSRKFERTREWKYLTYKCLEYLPGRLITVRKMGGGISSAVTFKATKGVKMGKEHLQTPSIIKIDSSYNTMMEFERYFRMIRPYMANEAGRIERPELVLNREYSAIVYTFAGKQDVAHELRAMSDMVENDMLCEKTCDFEKYRYALNCVFDEILPKIHRVSPTIEFGTQELKTVPESYTVDAFSSSFGDRMLSSFPNPYFNESNPKEFWRSYVMRFQPWGRISIDNLNELQVQGRIDLGSNKGNSDLSKSSHKLTFHSTMADPANNGRMIIEAYTGNMQLLWLDGDASDFIARFRKHIQPGSSLWFKDEISFEDKRNEWMRLAVEGWDVATRDKKLNGTFRTTVKVYSKSISVISCVELQDEILRIAKAVSTNASDWNCKCPVGIVHGDLNLANVMLESRLHAPKDGDPDTKSTVSDVWFIDFARTRRDIIAHDFNVYFTSVLSALFTPDLLSDESYQAKLKKHFRALVVGAIISEAKSLAAVPDAFKDDARLAFAYKMLRRGREAALKAGVSQNMYTLTTALACLYTMKIFLNNRPRKIKDPKLPIIKAAGFLAAAKICHDLLPSEMQEAGKAKA